MSEAVDISELFDVIETKPGHFIGKHPLVKPAPEARAVFGGNTAGQALLVAMKSSPEGFRPHSLHSYFILPVSDLIVIEWEVESISSGNTFANRHVRGYQQGRVVYYANISLTKKNSHGRAVSEYEEYLRKVELAKEKRPTEGNGDDDDDDEDLDIVVKPFEFQTPYHHWFSKHDFDKIPIDSRTDGMLVYHKMLPEMYDLSLTQEETKLAISERKISYLAQWGCPELNKPLKNVSPEMQYVGLAVLSDSMFLTRLARLLRIDSIDLTNQVHYMSVSLDHVVYFHDDDFDVTKWIGMSCQPTRFMNRRALFECEMFNEKGVHIASVVQEGLVHFNGLEDLVKL